jgi:hypothetical protein
MPEPKTGTKVKFQTQVHTGQESILRWRARRTIINGRKRQAYLRDVESSIDVMDH